MYFTLPQNFDRELPKEWHWIGLSRTEQSVAAAKRNIHIARLVTRSKAWSHTAHWLYKIWNNLET